VGGGCLSMNSKALNRIVLARANGGSVLLIDPRTRQRHHPEFVVDDI
jgi:hypothetical protein